VNVIIFGPPGAGKGTQADYIANKFNLYQISMGNLLRDEIKKQTDIGIEIEKIISAGNFATDDIVNKLLIKIITNPSYRNRIIFDGYPRNIFQAKSLEKILTDVDQSISFILYLNVSREIIEKRILGRLTCEKCNKTFNKFYNIKEIENHECDRKFLKKRSDDDHETVIARYDNYMKKTKPVLDFYSSLNKFHEIDGSHKIEVISAKISEILAV